MGIGTGREEANQRTSSLHTGLYTGLHTGLHTDLQKEMGTLMERVAFNVQCSVWSPMSGWLVEWGDQISPASSKPDNPDNQTRPVSPATTTIPAQCPAKLDPKGRVSSLGITAWDKKKQHAADVCWRPWFTPPRCHGPYVHQQARQKVWSI